MLARTFRVFERNSSSPVVEARLVYMLLVYIRKKCMDFIVFFFLNCWAQGLLNALS